MIDTLIGSLIAGLAVWLVLPSWQSRQLHRVAANSLRMQAVYLREIVAQYRLGRQDNLAYRLARRNAHNADAALSSAVSAVMEEPGYVRRQAGEGWRFLVLSHTLLNYLSALGAHRDTWALPAPQSEAARAVEHLLTALETLALVLEGQQLQLSEPRPEGDGASGVTPGGFGAVLRLAERLLPDLRAEAVRLAGQPAVSASRT